MYIRRCLELWSRGKVFRRSILVQGKRIPLFITPEAQLKYLKLGKNAFDSDLIGIAENFLNKQSVVWDIGANVGVFTFSAASVASQGTVVSIDADTWLAGLLRRTSRTKNFENHDIRVLPAAVAQADGVLKFCIARRGRAASHLEDATGERTQSGGKRETQYVPALQLNTLLKTLPEPEFVKVDVEGAEWMVLEGADDLIKHSRPIFYIEVSPVNSNEVLQVFRDNKYIGTDESGQILENKCSSNNFFIPEEKYSDTKRCFEALA